MFTAERNNRLGYETRPTIFALKSPLMLKAISRRSVFSVGAKNFNNCGRESLPG